MSTTYISWFISCWIEISWKDSGKAGLGARSSWDTCCIVGRDFGLEWRHVRASITTRTTLRPSGLQKGWERCGSKISLSIMCWVDDNDNKDEVSSPGCLPIMPLHRSCKHRISLSQQWCRPILENIDMVKKYLAKFLTFIYITRSYIW